MPFEKELNIMLVIKYEAMFLDKQLTKWQKELTIFNVLQL